MPISSKVNEEPGQTKGSMIFRITAGLRARLLAGTSANLIGQGIVAAIQLLSLPMFLHFWDAARYGKWVMLSAVPAYFAISDGGMIPVAANKINMLQSGGNTEQANAVFQSTLALVLSAIAAFGFVAALVLALLSDRILDFDSRFALWLLILVTLIGLFGGLFDAGFRAFGNYAQGVLYANANRMLDFVGLAIGLTVGGTFTAAALGMLAGRCTGSVFLWQICRRRFPALRWGLAHAKRHELRLLLRPALTYLAFPLGNALSIQAITLIVGALFGTVVVAMFNTYRTLSRLVLQVTATFSHAIWNEFSRLYGAGLATALRRVYRRGAIAGSAISVISSLVMILAAPLVLHWWTHGKIAFEAPLFLLFALSTLVGGLSHVPRVLLLSTNCHGRLAMTYLVLAALSVIATYLAGGSLGPSGAVSATVIMEATMLYLTMSLCQRMLGEMSSEI